MTPHQTTDARGDVAPLVAGSFGGRNRAPNAHGFLGDNCRHENAIVEMNRVAEPREHVRSGHVLAASESVKHGLTYMHPPPFVKGRA